MNSKITVIAKNKIKSLWKKVDLKTVIQKKTCISCILLSVIFLFITSACTSYNNTKNLNLTYIGKAQGPNANIIYFLQGPTNGETVVLLPGMGRGACEFRELAAALNNAGYRTVAIQPRGIGRSGPILTNPTYDQFAEDVALVLNDIPGGISGEKVHVLGYEFGNRIARMYAVKYPEHVGALILLACGGQKVSDSNSNTKISKQNQSNSTNSTSDQKKQNNSTITKKVSESKPVLLSPSAITEKIDSFFQNLVANTKTTDPNDVTLSGMIAAFAYWFPPSERVPYVKRAFFAPMSQVPYYWVTGWYRDTGWMQEQMDVDHSSPSADWVSGGNAPMLILQGEYDVAAPVKNGTYMKKTYPDRVTMFVVPKAGHAMLAEQPDFIINHVISYLDKQK